MIFGFFIILVVSTGLVMRWLVILVLFILFFDDMVDWVLIKVIYCFCFPGGGVRLKRDCVVVVK